MTSRAEITSRYANSSTASTGTPPAVREELLAMSAATIDRYLKGARDGNQLRGIATTKPSPLLRSSITIRKAGDEAEPGFFVGDAVAHCGPTNKGESLRSRGGDTNGRVRQPGT